MNARDKLNGVVVGACLFGACIFGAALGSWGAFWIILIVMIVGSSGAGGIRTHTGARPPGAGGGRRHARGRRS